MRQTFLYKLYGYSKPAFILVMAFIVLYAIFFVKKMDMVLFPHNSMFASIDPGLRQYSVSYGLRLNDSAIRYSSFPYWKKDFIESSVSTYAKYISQDKKVYLQQYFDATGKVPQSWQPKLIPLEKSSTSFLPWLIGYAGTTMEKNAKIELYQYRFVFQSGHAILKDSLLVFSQKTFVPR